MSIKSTFSTCENPFENSSPNYPKYMGKLFLTQFSLMFSTQIKFSAFGKFFPDQCFPQKTSSFPTCWFRVEKLRFIHHSPEKSKICTILNSFYQNHPSYYSKACWKMSFYPWVFKSKSNISRVFYRKFIRRISVRSGQ